MEHPKFRYHPDPVASGSVVASKANCACCGQARGFVYDGPVYSEEEEDLSGRLCPWCIADGSAHAKFDAEFVDSEGLEDGMPDAAAEEICQRTPGYATWQGERWPVCCGEGMAFISPVDGKEMKGKYLRLEGTAMMYIVHELGISGGAATRLLASLQKDHSPTGYVFQCVVCETQQLRIDQG